MGLIYVDPEGPDGKPDPYGSASDVRQTFRRMAMNDIETAALIVGGHTFGKTHGAGPADLVGPPPAGAPLDEQDLGWKNRFGTGVGPDTTSSGIEVTWTQTPLKFDNTFLENLYGFDWEPYKGPGGKWQWRPKDNAGADLVPYPFDAHKHHQPNMLTSDIALKVDPEYHAITSRWLHNPDEFAEEFRKAWFKLIHRDMGPITRYRGSQFPKEPQLFQDPIEPVTHKLIGADDIAALKGELLNCGVSQRQLLYTAWGAASSYRGSDMRGGANGGRIRLAPQRDWARNEPASLAQVVPALEGVQRKFNDSRSDGVAVSFADLVVLGGVAALEQAAAAAGHQVTVPFTPGRGDATQDWTEISSFDDLEGFADGFRSYIVDGAPMEAEYMLLDKAELLRLSAPEMTVLIGGMRVLNLNYEQSPNGVLTDRPGALTNDFFVNLLDMRYEWKPSEHDKQTFVGIERATGKQRWTAGRIDLAFGWDAQLRATSEVYGARDGEPKFVADFIAAWTKVMDADRFDLHD
ncbi:hypothetical protein GCM10011591_15380 [Nocardia camponoti]|uniref:catalase peroxidase n=1 Tax=Nocardia camponoti TaxID=1616106 RepID=A0A917QCZ4_9NOCA|nr:hypothetical protein GCM10011591_15380 [Nocardia camponoti]